MGWPHGWSYDPALRRYIPGLLVHTVVGLVPAGANRRQSCHTASRFMTRRAIEIAILIALFLPPGNLSPASVDQEWLTPAYPAQTSEQHTVTLKYKYTYEERQFIPSYLIEPSPRNTWAFTSPESAMIARASAMKQLDFEGWLATWDQPSQLEMQEKAKKRNHELSEIVDQW